jgi:serine/threonine protein kinase
VAGQAAEQIIAGVVLSERLAVTMYGAIHRAQFGGQRNLRGLVVDPKMLAEEAFRIPLTNPKWIDTVMRLAHPHIVPTVAVECGGPDVVVVMRGAGRYVTVQDLITEAKARVKHGGKIDLPVAALIGKSVIEALAVAHKAGVIHGAVHPRSVLVDEDGGVRLGDFVVGRALTTAVAQGADSSLWRGLAGYIAPELVVGEDPTPGVDVFAVGAMLFAMLSGEVPPGNLRATPAVERLVQRALDTDPNRRYKTANDLLENLLEALEDDRWDIAEPHELVSEAGLATADANIDQATEDLLASLGSSSPGIQLPIRPSADLRAEASAARHKPSAAGSRLDALLHDLDDTTGLTTVDDIPVRNTVDPVAEIIKKDPRRREAIVQSRVPSLDDADDVTPLPPPSPTRDSESDMTLERSPRRASDVSGLNPTRRQSEANADEAAAIAAIGSLDAKRADSTGARATAPRPRVAKPIVEPIEDLDAKPPRLRSRWPGIIALLVVAGVGYFIYHQYTSQESRDEETKRKNEEDKQKHDEDERAAREAAALANVRASIRISGPAESTIWLKLVGRTPLESLPLSSAMMHELRVEGVPGHQPLDAQVLPANWNNDNPKNRHGKLVLTLKQAPIDPKSKQPAPTQLPAQPPKPPDATNFPEGRGTIRVETNPPGAEVWLLIGVGGSATFTDLRAGVTYELRVLKDGFLPGFVTIAADDWREGTDRSIPIDAAKKKTSIERSVELSPDPNAKPDPKKPR